TVSMGGNVMQKQVFDGERGMASAMGQKSELEGKQLDEMRLQAKIFPELDYTEEGYKLTLDEVEDIDGNPAYKVLVTNPLGTTVTEFYDVATAYKVRTVTNQETQMGPMTITASMGDYRDVEGVKIPFSVKQQTGPQAMDMKVVSVDLNSGVSDDVFSVE
ncbi:MAG: hypothetical protein LC658_06035, partial [Bacteroidales bacterium]|nr:hypothetical protein [Bacteroidales bacterium]